jgi:hypothetical protein
VLGILAIAGHDPVVLTLAAMLVLGVTVLLTGTALPSSSRRSRHQLAQ